MWVLANLPCAGGDECERVERNSKNNAPSSLFALLLPLFAHLPATRAAVLLVFCVHPHKLFGRSEGGPIRMIVCSVQMMYCTARITVFTQAKLIYMLEVLMIVHLRGGTR